MNELLRIRKEVFRETQAGFAEIAGVSQGTVSRWEGANPSTRLSPTHDQLSRIRAAARSRQIAWRDEWFFERPQVIEEKAAGAHP